MRKLQIIVCIAGEGNRFKYAGIKTPKPFIRVAGHTILEWTLSSLPFILGHGIDYDITFAMRNEHVAYQDDVIEMFHPQTIVWFDKTTRGNLETALLTLKGSPKIAGDAPLLILDGDMKYNGGGYIDFLYDIHVPGNHVALCYFEPTDDGRKWSCAWPQEKRIVNVEEKVPDAVQRGGKPIIGAFFFSDADVFRVTAQLILARGETVNNEYYMSQVYKQLATVEYAHCPVFGHKVSDVVPLGTPEDVLKFGDMNENLY